MSQRARPRGVGGWFRVSTAMCRHCLNTVRAEIRDLTWEWKHCDRKGTSLYSYSAQQAAGPPYPPKTAGSLKVPAVGPQTLSGTDTESSVFSKTMVP